jgi:hypothetical protein
MENRRVGFAESIYSNLSQEESKEFNAKVLTNLSEVDMADYLTQTQTETKVETITMVLNGLIASAALLLIAAIVRYYKV